MSRRTLLVGLALLAALGLSSWLSRQSIRELAPPVAEERHTPDYFIAAFEATTLDDQGRPRRHLSAEYMSHFADDGTTEMTLPKMVLIEPESRWNVSAQKAWANREGTEVLLEGDVRLEQEPGLERAGWRLHTETLRLEPERHYAETEAPLTITGPGTEVEAVGMRADMASEQITLLEQVRGTYAPVRN